VDTEYSFSDHRFILFDLNLKASEPVMYRNKRKTDWGAYKDILDEKLLTIPDGPITKGDIEDRTHRISEAIVSSFHEACPLKRTRRKGPTHAYWTTELTRLRKSAQKAQRLWVTSGYSEEQRPNAKASKREYKKALRTAKRNSWASFVEEIDTLPKASRLYKILARDKSINLGPLKLPDGSHTGGVAETLERLLEIHFPKDPAEEPLEEWNAEGHTKEDEEMVHTMVNEWTVASAIKSFGSYKAAGPDEIFPALLQQAPKKLTSLLTQLMRASVLYGYVPKQWKQTKVVFIPKPGKATYAEAGSWRPISLTSFLLKTLERILDWRLRTPALIKELKELGQYAYLSDASTECAMHVIVTEAEKALRNRQYAICVLLDIEGAFSHATFRSMIRGMRRKGLCPIAVRWTNELLRGRTATVSLEGISRVRRVERGCPQGGVLSPLLWILLLDELLSKLRETCPSLISKGYADDVGLLGRGTDISTVTSRVQEGLDVIGTWCKKVDLGVLAEKSKALLFTNSRLYHLEPLVILGGRIPMEKSAKYLGVTLDDRLTWRTHCENKAKTAIIAMAQCRRAIGRSWGLKPSIMYWLYTSVIRPAMEYGAMVWVGATYNANLMNKLRRVQRSALLSTCGGMRSTPTAALECLMDLPPIELRLREVAMRTMHRLHKNGDWTNWDGLGITTSDTHVRILARLAKQMNIFQLPTEKTGKRIIEPPAFRVEVLSRKRWHNNEGLAACEPGSTHCYTDGSKLDTGSSGSGIFILRDTARLAMISIPLGNWPTVSQTEVYALLTAATTLLNSSATGENIHFFSDSLSTILALTSTIKQSDLVRECRSALNTLGRRVNVTVHWIPAHEGYEGNEIADSLAKHGATMQYVGPEPAFPIPINIVHERLRQGTRREQELLWRSLHGHRQAKAILDRPSKANSMFCRSQDRRSLRLLTDTVTGHGLLNKHRMVMELTSDPICPTCGLEDEDRDHFLCRCESHCTLRHMVMGVPLLEPANLQGLPLRLILEFIKKSKRFDKDTHGEAS
jgi:ribonuclease HI